ncbi:hypothetical protein PUN28_001385 [Cardiocondyla obscurior]|uniref:Secreted protein n=1 Tax=Cardiocondyla obscurior TaxID=286306 RepID=A0AAW2H4Q5_9HYME
MIFVYSVRYAWRLLTVATKANGRVASHSIFLLNLTKKKRKKKKRCISKTLPKRELLLDFATIRPVNFLIHLHSFVRGMLHAQLRSRCVASRREIRSSSHGQNVCECMPAKRTSLKSAKKIKTCEIL